MNRMEFEAAIGDRILVPISTWQFGQIFFKTEYSPEDFVKKMNAPGNSAQTIDKQMNGLGVWKYSCNTLTNGFIYTNVSDPQAGGTGAGGNPMGIKEWMDQHADVRSAFKYAVVYGVGFLLTYVAAVATNGMIDQQYVPFVVIAVGVLTEKSKLLDPTVPWPIVGAGKK